LSYGGKGSLLLDDLVLTYADDTVPTQSVAHSGHRDATTSGQTMLVDGAPYLALGFVRVPYEDLEAAKEQGANTLVWDAEQCFNTAQPDYRDRAYELGMGLVPESIMAARTDNAVPFPSILEQYGNHLGIVTWFLTDEPDLPEIYWAPITPATLVAEYQSAKTKSSLPMTTCYQKASWDVVDTGYRDAGSMWMSECYGYDLGDIANAATNFAHMGSGISGIKPTWTALDGAIVEQIVPKAYYAIIKRMTGIVYFRWGTIKSDPTRLAPIKQVFTELRSLKAVIFDQSRDPQLNVSGGIATMARSSGGSTYILAVNPNASTVAATFSLTGLAAGKQVQVLFESRTLTSTTGQFTDTFAGIARHVYRIDP
jgi:hypothetical protein